MTRIATLTLNPTIDVTYEVDRIFPTHKIRSRFEHHDPGGGGINVARVFARLGGNVRCYYLSGGATGQALDGLLDLHQLVRNRIAIEGHTRVSTTVLELESGKEYRLVPPGPTVAPAEWQECLDRLAEAQCDYLVASGSLPPGVPDDFYARIAQSAAARGIRMVLDSSGAGLKGGLAGGNVFLVKPSIGELARLVERDLPEEADVAAAAMEIVRNGQARYVAVTMGHQGGLLAQASGTVRVPAIPIEAKSTVGAGDSFLSAMVFALAGGRDPVDAFRYGIAAGAAAVLRPGTNLCQPADIERFFASMDSANAANLPDA
ncbi:MAG: 1-phosphofructokinase family hexose kinase [Alphaproteobacteria bacterium]|nr:1-phosphofructokinase family hexose kinase [Alphaproteobacteria bacterium]